MPASSIRFGCRVFVILLLAISLAPRPTKPLLAQEVTYEVPGSERWMQLLPRLQQLHQPSAFSDCTLWDPWLPRATLGYQAAAADRYQAGLLARRIDSQGYVSMQQHRGMAHSEGWPFPAWQQSTGKGWHFSLDGDIWAIQNFRSQPETSWDSWEIQGAQVEGIDPIHGLVLKATTDHVVITTPKIGCGTIVAPFARLEMAHPELPAGSEGRIQWRMKEEADWKVARHVAFQVAPTNGTHRYYNIPLYMHPDYGGLLEQWKIELPAVVGSKWLLKSVCTAIDTRHPITNTNYLIACSDLLEWTGRIDFLRENIDKMRTALRFAIEEFSVEREGLVLVPWVGHDGRSGLMGTEGDRKIRPGLGVGNNYWDLLPFGGRDALASMMMVAALDRMARLEKEIAAHPQWGIPAPQPSRSGMALENLATRCRETFQQRFWSDQTRRLIGWENLQGQRYDYGFTFLNLEAVARGLTTPEQARSIFDWIDGRRRVEGDTSQGEDIYHWRFGPRATTKRNVEAYCWAWSDPGSIPWGGQVQDGGAVLGFSYFDWLARIRTNGPDDAWAKMQQTLEWFEEVQAAGGYRTYYKDGTRGTLQGGGTAGGLGLDEEFLESALVPTILVDGFLGWDPRVDGAIFQPRLPKSWPSLKVRNLRFHGNTIDLEARQDGSLRIEAPKDHPDWTIRTTQGEILWKSGETVWEIGQASR